MIDDLQIKNNDEFIDAYASGQRLTVFDVVLLPNGTKYRIDCGNGFFSEEKTRCIENLR